MCSDRGTLTLTWGERPQTPTKGVLPPYHLPPKNSFLDRTLGVPYSRNLLQEKPFGILQIDCDLQNIPCEHLLYYIALSLYFEVK